MGLEIRPCKLRDANNYVAQHHRHNQPTNGHKFSVACYDGERLCGVAIAGQPVARLMDDGYTIEIRRVCTDGTRNACSILYAACVRAAKALGYHKVITYTLQTEPGTSVKAAGFQLACENCGGGWDRPSRPRENEQITMFGIVKKYSEGPKNRWEKLLK